MKRKSAFRFFRYFLSAMFLLSVVGIVRASPSFNTVGTTFYLTEDQSPLFQFNFSTYVTNPSGDPLTFQFINITSNPPHNLSTPAGYSWIYWANSSQGILKINATLDNQTGLFNATVFVHNVAGQGQSELFYFIINATNDPPQFTVLSQNYSARENVTFFNYYQCKR